MANPTPVLFSWSGGKDSALALHTLLQRPDDWEVVGLLCSVADEFRRVSHHGVREGLLFAQAEAIGLPLDTLRIPFSNGPCRNEDYEKLIGDKLQTYVDRGVKHVAHGDLFLADLRAYREMNLAKLGLTGVFPIWGYDTRQLIEDFEDLGFKSLLCCVQGDKLGASFAGRHIDRELLRDLPADVDPCGENGEYHSFVYDGPIFQRPIDLEIGPVVTRDNRHYLELLPAGVAQAVTADSMPPVR
jgi:uncharacterized protein (TIGR00290 family)